MAINIGENTDKEVTYVNSPDINRVLFKNLSEGASADEIAEAVNAWIEEHPEAVTTVQDGSILPVKLDSSNEPSDGYVLSWNATAGKFEWIDIQSDITELKADFNNSVDVSDYTWVLGTLNPTSGAEGASTTRVRSDYIQVTSGTTVTVSGDANCLIVYRFNGEKTYISPASSWTDGNKYVVPEGTTYIRVLIRKPNDGTISAEEIDEQVSRCSIRLALPASVYYYDYNTGKVSYTVKKDGTGDYTSVIECFRDLADDTERKTVYIYGGTYDIYEEMGGDDFIATITNPSELNWRDVSVLVPDNTKVVGVGDVVLSFLPTASQIGSNAMALLFSPLNLSGNAEIENIKVVGTNCRYAIHDESSGLPQYADTVHKYKNVTAIMYKGTYGNTQAFNSGVGARSRWYFEGCTFKNDFLGNVWAVHTTTSSATDKALIDIKNSIFGKIDGTSGSSVMTFTSGGANNLARVEVFVSNSYLNGTIAENNNGSSVPQRFDLTLLNCNHGNVVVQEGFSENNYPAQIFDF